MKSIEKYFPGLSDVQKARFAALDSLYRDWNAKINVISRKDIDSLYLHHVLHSLAIAKAVAFEPGASVLDVGTGGGFPGIPLAIFFPEVRFTLCDSIGKKIKVASSVAQELGLGNVECVNARVESLGGGFDYIVSRAVTNMADFYGWIKGSYRKSVICLKGGEVEQELAACFARHRLSPSKVTVCDIPMWFEEEYFEGKKMVIIGQ